MLDGKEYFIFLYLSALKLNRRRASSDWQLPHFPHDVMDFRHCEFPWKDGLEQKEKVNSTHNSVGLSFIVVSIKTKGRFKKICELVTRSFNVHLYNTRFPAANNFYVNAVSLLMYFMTVLIKTFPFPSLMNIISPSRSFCEFVDLGSVSVHKHAKTELGQYLAILT